MVLPDGLVVVPEFVTLDEEDDLVSLIGTSSTSTTELDRERVLRYGPGVLASGYSSGEILEGIPPYLRTLAQRLYDQALVAIVPNAISVNEYRVGQGISFHTDNNRSGPVISCLGLLGNAVMQFKRRGILLTVPFPRRALLQLTGAVRNIPWLHSIPPVTEHRISIVFRHAGGEPA